MRLCTHVHVQYACTRSQIAKVRGIPPSSLIDVTITAIYPEARLFLCDTRTTTPGPPREEYGWGPGEEETGREQGGKGNCWMRPSKWVPSLAVGATMAKYKSKSQPPSFLLSFRPRTSATPLSSSLVYSLRAFPDDASPGSRYARSLSSPGNFSPAIQNSWPLFRASYLFIVVLYAAPLSSALIRLTLLHFSDHFGFYLRTSRSNKIMDDKLNRK